MTTARPGQASLYKPLLESGWRFQDETGFILSLCTPRALCHFVRARASRLCESINRANGDEAHFLSRAGSGQLFQDEAAYQDALTLVNDLMERSEDSVDDPLKPMLDLLFQSIDAFEMQDRHFRAFHDEAMGIPGDLAALGVLMDQHGLGVNDSPEIGSKLLVSRILSGERNLTKRHIQVLSERFGISPANFFD